MLSHALNKIVLFLVVVTLGSFLLKQLPKKESVAAKIVIFSKASCFYCFRAKLFFREKNLSYKEVEFDKNSPQDLALLKKFTEQAGTKLKPRITVPQIFIGKKHIGGFTDLIKLSDKELKKIL